MSSERSVRARQSSVNSGSKCAILMGRRQRLGVSCRWYVKPRCSSRKARWAGRKAMRRTKLVVLATFFALCLFGIVVCVFLIQNYRWQWDMEMTYAEMTRHVRNAQIVLACFGIAGATAAWAFVRILRKRVRADHLPEGHAARETPRRVRASRRHSSLP